MTSTGSTDHQQDQDVTDAHGPGKPTYVLGTTHTLSDVARGTGLSLSYVSRVFSGKRTPRVKAVRSIAAYLGIPLEEFLTRLEQLEELPTA